MIASRIGLSDGLSLQLRGVFIQRFSFSKGMRGPRSEGQLSSHPPPPQTRERNLDYPPADRLRIPDSGTGATEAAGGTGVLEHKALGSEERSSSLESENESLQDRLDAALSEIEVIVAGA